MWKMRAVTIFYTDVRSRDHVYKVLNEIMHWEKASIAFDKQKYLVNDIAEFLCYIYGKRERERAGVQKYI